MLTATSRAAQCCGAWMLACCVAIAFCAACESDPTPDEDTAPSKRDAPTSRPTHTDAGISREDASKPLDDAAQPRSATKCAHPGIPAGELQDMASGSSVFGKVVGGELGMFDATGDTECGVAEVRICLRGSETCTESDAAGQFVLADLPEGVDAEISFEKPDFRPVLRLAQLGATPIDLRQTRIVTSSAFSNQLQEIGEPEVASTGSIVSVAVAPGEGVGGFILPAGVTMALFPGGDAPFFSVGEIKPGGLSSDDLDRSLTSTRLGGWGLFYNVPPGDYAIRFEREGTPCDQNLPGYGYGLDDDGNVKLRVVEGFSTGTILVVCQ